jgi:hypothetical protein
MKRIKLNLGDPPWISIVALILVLEKTFLFYEAHPYPLSAVFAYGFTFLWYLMIVACFFAGKIRILFLRKKGDVYVWTAIISGIAFVLNELPPWW